MQALSEIYRLNAKETFALLTENGRAGLMKEGRKEAAHKTLSGRHAWVFTA
jgi:hypothetical protein